MPEGDTIYRAAALLRPVLVGFPVLEARVSRPGPAIEHVLGAVVEQVEPRGKHLLIAFANGLILHTHLRMRGAWHVYRPGEHWLRPERQARLMLRTAAGTAVCFNAPVVELFRAAAAPVHRALEGLGPDLLAETFDEDLALRRWRDPARRGLAVGEVLLDQRVMAGCGNVYRSEVLFLQGVDPSTLVADLEDDRLRALMRQARALLMANRGRGMRTTTSGAMKAAGARLWVYGRTGRPCLRCGTPIRSGLLGRDLPRRAYWCPRCQPAIAPDFGRRGPSVP